MSRLWLIRHGETEWSTAGRHTGRSDISLTARGERQAELLGARFAGHELALVFTSPLRRAKDTCRTAGLGDRAVVDADLSEWDYGNYEGWTRSEIRIENPAWTIWSAGVPGGETLDAVAARTDRVIARALAARGEVALFAHGHLLRILAARWLNMPPTEGRSFALDTASISILGQEEEQRVVELWNDRSHLANEG